MSNKILIGILVVAMVALFAALSQPAWRGQQMVAQLKSDCAKRGGVVIDDPGMFGDTYSCESRLDR